MRWRGGSRSPRCGRDRGGGRVLRFFHSSLKKSLAIFKGGGRIPSSADEPPTKTKESMRIKVSIQNNAAINAELLKVNGKATSFTITSTSQILSAIKQAEQRLSILPKSKWKGVVFAFSPAGPTARAYKYNSTSTVVRVERGASDWFLISIAKAAVSPQERERLSVEITPDQAAEIQARAVSDFYITQNKAIAA